MPDSPYPAWMSPVFAGAEPDGLIWQVLAGWTDDGHLMTTLYIDTPVGPRPVGGFGGPPIWEGHLINHWYGRNTDLDAPPFVVLRAREQVTKVALTTIGSDSVDIPLSALRPEFGVRFGATALPRNLDPRDSQPRYDITQMHEPD